MSFKVPEDIKLELSCLIAHERYTKLEVLLRRNHITIYDAPDAFFELLSVWTTTRHKYAAQILFKQKNQVHRMFSFRFNENDSIDNMIDSSHMMVAAGAEEHMKYVPAFLLPFSMLNEKQRTLVERVQEAAVRFERHDLELPRRLTLLEIAKTVWTGASYGKNVCAITNPDNGWNIFPLAKEDADISDETRAIWFIHRLRHEGPVRGEGGEHFKLAGELLMKIEDWRKFAVRFCSFCHPIRIVGCEFMVPFELFYRRTEFEFDEEGKVHALI